ncbi:MAG: CPBP family intramembrane metalloprotease [Planctomycetes bacterium]|nr:CPBP family intramembrane metalloprotease [Planctomycetota bacterium]MCP4838380.1 CPBP family intramembrane metalloprotease [Planctomycetota bacterium]
MQPHDTSTSALGHRPLPTLAALLPLIVFLEAALLFNAASPSASRILAHVQIGAALHFFGLSPLFVLHATSFVVLATLIAWHVLVGEKWRLSLTEPARLLLEGFIGVAPLLAAAAFLGTMQSHALTINPVEPVSAMDAVAIAIGAGLSEELLFRMVGIATVHWLLVDVAKFKPATGTLAAIIATTVAFTLYHDPSAMPANGVVFVTLAGAYLGWLYVFRGFAVAVVAHAGYDVVVLLGQVTS